MLHDFLMSVDLWKSVHCCLNRAPHLASFGLHSFFPVLVSHFVRHQVLGPLHDTLSCKRDRPRHVSGYQRRDVNGCTWAARGHTQPAGLGGEAICGVLNTHWLTQRILDPTTSICHIVTLRSGGAYTTISGRRRGRKLPHTCSAGLVGYQRRRSWELLIIINNNNSTGGGKKF